MTRSAIVAMTCLLASLGQARLDVGPGGDPQEPAGQRPQAEFRATVDLVLLHVAVLDADGLPVADLGPDDFVVSEDGVRQPIRFFLSPDTAPLDVALLLDTSGSVESDRHGVRRGMEDFVAELGPSDGVLAVPFAGDIAGAEWLSARDGRMAGILRERSFEGGTRLHDALLASLARLRARRDGYAPGEGRRQAVVLVSDGVDEGSMAGGFEVLAAAWETKVPIFAVPVGVASERWHLDRALDTARMPRRRGSRASDRLAIPGAGRRERRHLEGFARASGGWLVDSDDAYAEIVARLRASYVLGFRPARGGDGADEEQIPRWREVDVEVAVYVIDQDDCC